MRFNLVPLPVREHVRVEVTGDNNISACQSLKHVTLNQFKSLLSSYYKDALISRFDIEEPGNLFA